MKDVFFGLISTACGCRVSFVEYFWGEGGGDWRFWRRKVCDDDGVGLFFADKDVIFLVLFCVWFRRCSKGPFIEEGEDQGGKMWCWIVMILAEFFLYPVAYVLYNLISSLYAYIVHPRFIQSVMESSS